MDDEIALKVNIGSLAVRDEKLESVLPNAPKITFGEVIAPMMSAIGSGIYAKLPQASSYEKQRSAPRSGPIRRAKDFFGLAQAR